MPPSFHPISRALRLALFALAAMLHAAPPLAAQEQPPATPIATRAAQSLPTLETLRAAIEDKRADLERSRASGNTTAAARDQAELDKLQFDFQAVATGIDVEAFETGRRKEFDLKAELEKLIAPILEELKAATEAPRQIEELRTQLGYLLERQELAKQAIAHLDKLLAANPDEALRLALEKEKASWVQRAKDLQSQASVARYQLDTRLESRQSVLQEARKALADFFRTRGLNLLLAAASFVVVFVGLRWIYRQLRRISPIHRRAERPTYTRLIDVLFHGFTGVAAVLASLIVLYARGDWVLLGIALLFLLGLAWASKAAAPQFVEQIRILLNLGTVRELERVVYNGLPWRVSRLSLYTLLSNPELSGGLVRLPVKQLTEMRSRPVAADDVWFPSHRNDWVRLADGRVGQVLHQSPEAVKLKTLGGSVVTYPTLDYLAQSPENLSGGFTVSVTFGIDYEHQPISTVRVPQVMRPRLEAAIHQVVPPDDVTRLVVEFQSAGASSLDYAVFVGLKGSQAERVRSMERLVQRTLVDTCNDEGWVIPFTQVTIHQAAGGNGSEPVQRDLEPQSAR